MIVIAKNIYDIHTAENLADKNVIILDMEMIRKDRQRVYDQVAALYIQMRELKEERARLLILPGMDHSRPEVRRISERLNNAKHCLNAFKAQRKFFDFMLQYISEKRKAAHDEPQTAKSGNF